MTKTQSDFVWSRNRGHNQKAPLFGLIVNMLSQLDEWTSPEHSVKTEDEIDDVDEALEQHLLELEMGEYDRDDESD